MDHKNKLNVTLSGFQTASGKTLMYNKDKIMELEDNEKIHCQSSQFKSGFQTASGKTLMYNKDKIMELEDNEKINSEPSEFTSDFQTAGGKILKYKREKILELDTEIKQDDDLKLNLVQSGFQTAGGKALLYNKDKMIDFESDEVSDDSKGGIELSGFETASGKTLLFNKNKTIKIDDNDNNMYDIQTKDSKNNLETKTIIESKENFKNDINQKLTTNRMLEGKKFKKPQLIDKSKMSKYLESSSNELTKADNHEFCKELQVEFENMNHHIFKPIGTMLPYCAIKDLNFFRNGELQSRLVKPVFELKKSEALYPKEHFDLFMSWNQKRSIEIEKLCKRLELKQKAILRPSDRSKPGFFFQKKDLAKQSKQIIKISKLKINSTNPNQINNNIDLNNLEEFKFNLADFRNIHDEFIKNGYYQTPDQGYLIPDEKLQIGLNELYSCFLDSNGVDAKLVDLNWFKNHLKWILWKFKAYDEKLSENFQKINLNPLNVINQIKYRYDIEIGLAKRSSIKKIVEKDDSSMNKTLILFLSKISKTINALTYVELCDGWYPIKAQFDVYLSEFLKRGRIKLGDKLVIFSPELVGCPKDGISPLEAPEEMFFKLSVNSTRRAKCFSKLGFIKPQRPLIVSINSIKANSIVGAIDVLVERIYPIIFMEKKQDGSKIYRNQKQEDMLLYSKMIDIEESENKENKSETNDLKNSQKRNVSQILRIRIRDFNSKNENSCLITFWQNSNDIYDKIIEGERILIFNLTACNHKNGMQDGLNVSLGTNRMTFYKKISSSSTRSLRKVTEYKEIFEGKIGNMFNEIDTCGVVIRHSSNNFSYFVYLTDLKDIKSVICICFPKNSEFFGYRDVLKLHNCVACLNLRFTRKLENSKYPSLMASEITIFTQKIHLYKYLENFYSSLNELLTKPEIKQHLFDLSNEIDKPVKNAKINIYENFNNNKSNNFKLNPTKEKKLASIIEASETVPMDIKMGSRQPGLVNKTKFYSPVLNRTTDSQYKNQLKRRSDTFAYSSANLDDEDSFISNCDLESLCKSSSSLNVSMVMSESIAKRIKKS